MRNANEQIEAAAERLQPSVYLIPFVCECGRLDCIVTLRLSLDDYEAIREDARWFICSPGHELAEAGHERVIETKKGYVIVEKQGQAADVAKRLDPRGAA